jgi:hypothetical protein
LKVAFSAHAGRPQREGEARVTFAVFVTLLRELTLMWSKNTPRIQKEARASKMKSRLSVWRLAPREMRGLLVAVRYGSRATVT